jgi:uncharacterized protein YcnI
VRRRRRELVVAGAAAVALWAPAVAPGHALVKPSASRPADSQLYTLTVPNERDVPTVEVALKVPANVENVVVENAPGWTTRIVRAGGRIDVIRFTGGSIAPDFFASFRLIARNPVEEGELVWAVTQRYAGGEVVGWTGPPDSDTPAPRTRITESAPATDVLDVAGGSTGDAETEAGAPAETTVTATTSEPSAAAESEDGGDTLPVVLSVVALLVALAALAAALRTRRP